MPLINAATATIALMEILRGHPDLKSVRIERSAELNTDASVTPWVGVYKIRQRYDISTIGQGAAHRRCTIDLLVVCQHSDVSSGDNAEDGLEALITTVVGAILDDETLRVGLASRNLQVQYADVRNDGGVYFQEAAITLSLLT